jgi:hypothetical protein
VGGSKRDERELEASLRERGIELEEGCSSNNLLCLLLVSVGFNSESLLLLLVC